MTFFTNMTLGVPILPNEADADVEDNLSQCTDLTLTSQDMHCGAEHDSDAASDTFSQCSEGGDATNTMPISQETEALHEQSCQHADSTCALEAAALVQQQTEDEKNTIVVMHQNAARALAVMTQGVTPAQPPRGCQHPGEKT